jgi:hypothetical protein
MCGAAFFMSRLHRQQNVILGMHFIDGSVGAYTDMRKYINSNKTCSREKRKK